MSPTKTGSPVKPTRRAKTDGKPSRAPAPQSAAAPSPFPPIANYAFLSNCHTGALVAPTARSIGCACRASTRPASSGPCSTGRPGIPPGSLRGERPDSPDLRAGYELPRHDVEHADRVGGGARRADDGPTSARRRVTPHTRPPTDEDADHMLVRTVLCLDGSVDDRAGLRAGLRLRAHTGRVDAGRRQPAHGRRHRRRPDDQAADRHGDRHRGRQGPGPARPDAGRPGLLLAVLGRRPRLAADVDEANARLAATTRFWRAWLGRARMPDHRWREPIQRSALAIKGLTYMPTGATVAALTTSLPETPGGERNWDYRYTWMRDTTFTLQALHYLNLDWEADEFMQFVADLEPNEDGALQIMYGDRRPPRPHRVDARRALRLRGRAPGADRQRRVRPAPERRLRCGAGLDPAAHPAQPAAAAAAVADRPGAGRVRRPASGVSPTRASGRPVASRSTTSPPSSWAGSRWTGRRGWPRSAATPSSRRPGAPPPTRSRPTSSSTGDRRGVLRQHYDTDALDASTLLAAIFGFLPARRRAAAQDRRWRSPTS